MSESKAKSNKNMIIIVTIFAAIIVILVGVIGYLMMSQKSADKDEALKRNVVVNEQNAEEIVSQMLEEERTPIGAYQVTMNTTWNFKDGSVASDNAFVQNVMNNTNPVYFDVVRSDTNETIFKSPILPIGTYLNNITLDSILEAGTYDCVCTYYLLDEDDKPVSQVSIALTINIKS